MENLTTNKDENSLCKNVSALMASIQWSDYKRVKSLIDNYRRMTPNDATESSSNVEKLLNSGCGPMNVLPLQLATNISDSDTAVRIVRLLLRNGGKANCCDKIGRTPLHHAATQGYTEVVKMLLDAGASPNSRYTVMPWPNKNPLLGECVDGADCSREATAANSLPFPECWGRTPLHQAVKCGHVSCVKVLLERGGNVNALDEKGLSPLLLAGAGITTDNSLAIAKYEKIVEMLVNKGADVNIVNEDIKCSPLHHSVLLGSLTATRLLLDAGASIDQKELLGETVLHVAASVGNAEVLNLLLRRHYSNQLHQSIDIRDKVGCTPLHKAAFSGNRDCLKLLINSGGNLAAITDSGLSVIDVIFSYIPRPIDFMTKILDSKIIPNGTSINDRGFKIMLDVNILAPKVERQTSVVSLLIEEAKIIQHPLIEAFIYLKWKRMRRIFLILFFIHVCYVVTMSIYSLILAHPGFINDSETSRPDPWWVLIKGLAFWLLVVSSVPLFTHSTIEMMLLGSMRYVQFEPLLNFICSLYSVVLVMISPNDDSPTIHDAKVIEALVHISSVVVLISWVRLMFLLSRFPMWGYYGLMFLAVLTNVLKVRFHTSLVVLQVKCECAPNLIQIVMMTFICLVIGFVLFFCIQFPKNQLFANPWQSLVKTVVMMAGEFEYRELFEDKDKKMLVTSRFVFLLFILLSTIVLMNLMVGLAVSDIQDLQIEGHVKRLTKQVDFISHLEKLTSHKMLYKLKIGQMLRKKYHLPNKLIIEACAGGVNNQRNNLPYCLLEAIISIALHNRKFKETRNMSRKQVITTPSRVGSADFETSMQTPLQSKWNLLSQMSKDSTYQGVESLYNNILEMKQMMQYIISNYHQQRDTNTGSASNYSNIIREEDYHSGDENEEVDSKVNAVLRKMSQNKRRADTGDYAIYHYQHAKQQKSVPI